MPQLPHGHQPQINARVSGSEAVHAAFSRPRRHGTILVSQLRELIHHADIGQNR